MGRKYTAAYEERALTTADDLIEIAAGAAKVVVVHSLTVTQSTEAGDSEAEMIHCTLQRATTSGTGGAPTTISAEPLDPGDAADGATVKYGNTTQAATLTLLVSESWNAQAGWFHRPTPEERIVLGGSDILVARLENAPTDSISFDVTLVFEEIG